VRLCTYSVEPGQPRLGAECGGAVLDLARFSHLHDGLRLPADMLGLIEAGPDAWRHARELCTRFAAELPTHDLAQDAEAGLAYPGDRIHRHAPIVRPRKDAPALVAVGDRRAVAINASWLVAATVWYALGTRSTARRGS